MKKVLGCLMAVMALAAAPAVFATEPVTVTMPVNVGDYITAAVTTVTGVVGIAIAAKFGWIVVRRAIAWAYGALKG